MNVVGYARVSTDEQDTALQLDALRIAGCQKIYSDKCSGVGARPELQACIRSLKPGQTLVVWKVDRLARSLADLLNILTRLKKSDAKLKSLTEPIDTTSALGEFTIQILGAFAQLERAMIRERSIAGQKAAAARGVHIGRKRSVSESQELEILRLREQGQTMRGISLAVGCSEATVKRAIYRVHRPGSTSLH